MAQHEKFHYRTLEEVKARCSELGITLPFADDTSALAEPLKVRNITFSSRVGSAPMEGADSTPEGSPSEMTLRRYRKIAEGGAAIMWFEAISVVPEGRSSKTQLLITKDNVDDYRRFTDELKEAGLKKNGHAPYLVMQANHSGRYSNPDNKPAPLIAYRHPYLEQFRAADDSCIVSDDYL
ncbi:MAG: NADH:flavin oxidoreductase, partial [Bullifex sp.]|nr:NADH:flavin oxidoreductase [Bullifex sp.]